MRSRSRSRFEGPPRRKRRGQRGLTLIELATVIVILALCVTVVTAYLDQTLPASRLESAARSLASRIDNLRTFSVAQGQPYRIEYDLAGHRYRTVSPFRVDGKLAESEEERRTDDWTPLPEGVVFDDIVIGAGDRLVEGTVGIEFSPLGGSVEHRVHLRRERPERRFTIAVAGLTGQVRFIDGYESREEVVEDDFPK